MLLILLSWIYILFTVLNLGFGLDKILRLKCVDFVLLCFFGLFAATLLGSFWALFGRINIEFHLFLLAFQLGIFLKYRSEINATYHKLYRQITVLAPALRYFMLLSGFLILAQCAAAPYIIDNETYYIQTIKWLNEYGFVKGLANLHLFYGQCSGWHVTQSVFNFSFLYDRFNDLSGFCLLLGMLFSVFRLDAFFKNQNPLYLAVGLLPLFHVLFFQFISAPSPDILVYESAFLLFFIFTEQFENPKPEVLNQLLVLALFAFYVKPTALILIGIPLFMGCMQYRIFAREIRISFLICLPVVALFCVKNTILTGYPLYPLPFFGEHADYAVAREVLDYYFSKSQLYTFVLPKKAFEESSLLQIGWRWLQLPGMNGWTNKLSLLLLLLVPGFLYRFKVQKAYWVLYLFLVLQMILLFLSSPQFRFFLHFILFFSVLPVAFVLHKRRFILSLLFGSSLLVILILFFPISYTALTKNQLLQHNSPFIMAYLVQPHPNSKLTPLFSSYSLGNLDYHSPDKNTFFWATGDGALPCVNQKQLYYFQKKFHLIPQKRSPYLKDGFYAKKTPSHEQY